MENKFCKVDGLVMKFVPAGYSKKTGKQYAAFWSCPSRESSHTENVETPLVAQPQTNQTASQPPVQPLRTPQQVLEAEKEKDLRISRLSLLSWLGPIVANHPEAKALDLDLIITRTAELANRLEQYVYDGNIHMEDIEPESLPF